MYHKASDKYKAGVSDFLIWTNGLSLAMEVKFIKTIPKPTIKLLGHTFSTEQISFLQGFDILGGGKAFGLIGVDCEKKVYPVWWKDIPSKGNWKTEKFFEQHKTCFDFKDIPGLMDYLFYGDAHG